MKFIFPSLVSHESGDVKTSHNKERNEECVVFIKIEKI
jgi:hypothetical protein